MCLCIRDSLFRANRQAETREQHLRTVVCVFYCVFLFCGLHTTTCFSDLTRARCCRPHTRPARRRASHPSHISLYAIPRGALLIAPSRIAADIGLAAATSRAQLVEAARNAPRGPIAAARILPGAPARSPSRRRAAPRRAARRGRRGHEQPRRRRRVVIRAASARAEARGRPRLRFGHLVICVRVHRIVRRQRRRHAVRRVGKSRGDRRVARVVRVGRRRWRALRHRQALAIEQRARSARPRNSRRLAAGRVDEAAAAGRGGGSEATTASERAVVGNLAKTASATVPPGRRRLRRRSAAAAAPSLPAVACQFAACVDGSALACACITAASMSVFSSSTVAVVAPRGQQRAALGTAHAVSTSRTASRMVKSRRRRGARGAATAPRARAESSSRVMRLRRMRTGRPSRRRRRRTVPNNRGRTLDSLPNLLILPGSGG